MNNYTNQIDDQVLTELDGLIEKTGVSRQEFLNYVAKVYNTNSSVERNVTDYDSYCDSFVG